MKSLVNTINLSKLKTALIVLFLLPCIFMLVACGQTQQNKAQVLNTKNMTEAEIKTYVSEEVLQNVKNDERHRTIVVLNINDDVPADTSIKWNLKLGNEVIIDDQDPSIYVDKDKPTSEQRRIFVMIGWDKSDLDKTWTVEFYYINNNDAKVLLDKVDFEVSSADYTKSATQS